MSIITVKLIEGLLSASQKQQLARALTDAVVRVEGEAMRALTWCIIEELQSGSWTIGGQPLTRKEMRVINRRCSFTRSAPASVSKRPAGSRTRV